MTEALNDERKAELAEYEGLWLEEHKKYKEESAVRYMLEEQLDALKRQIREYAPLLDTAERVPELESALAQARAELALLKERQAELQGLDQLKEELTQTKVSLGKAQRHVADEKVWHKLAGQFGEDVSTFPSIYGALRDTDEAICTASQNWSNEVQAALHSALVGDKPDLERAKRLLLAQWMLLRWLEITGAGQ